MRSRDKNRKIRIDAPITTEDPIYGTPIISWTEFDTIWAKVQDALPSKAEGVTMGLSMNKSQVTVEFDYRLGVQSAMRIVELEAPYRTLQIVGGPAIVGNRIKIQVQCEAIQ